VKHAKKSFAHQESALRVYNATPPDRSPERRAGSIDELVMKGIPQNADLEMVEADDCHRSWTFWKKMDKRRRRPCAAHAHVDG